MEKHLWKESTKIFGDHIDPQKEEQLKSRTIYFTAHSHRYHGHGFGYTGWQIVRSKLLILVEDFQKHYESLYSLYEDLRGEVKKKVSRDDYESSASTTDSELYYSPDELNDKDGSESPEVPDGDRHELEASDFEDTILKDKLTSTSEVKETIILGSESSFNNFLQSREILMDLGIQHDESESTKKILLDSSVLLKRRLVEREELLSLVKELEGQVEKWKLETETQSTVSAHIDALQTEKDRLQLESKALQNEKSRLQMELEKEKSEKEKRIIELNNKICDQLRIQIELEDMVSKLKDENKQVQSTFADSKSNFQIAERKVEEMVEELRKQFEDNLRILSRRIRVAEQLHMENKDWYRKKREMYEQENQDVLHAAKDMLNSLDTVTLKLEECNANFLNRISKASCELKSAKDWTMRKNNTLVHVRDDLDCLIAQLDDKEAEILVFRERLWKAENKVREVEKMMEEKEEAVLILQEEKREAIRQLCVWIDYHRSRSDYYKKMLSDITPPCRRTAF